MLHRHFEDILDRIGMIGYILIALESVIFVVWSPVLLFGFLAKKLVDVFTKTEVGTINITYLEPKPVMPTREQLSNAAERKHWLSLLSAGELPAVGQIRLYSLLGYGAHNNETD